MKKFGYILLISILVIVFFVFNSPSNADKNVPPEVISSSIKTFEELINATNYKKFGFENENQVKTLKAGKPVNKYFIELNKIKNYNGLDSIEQMVNLNYSVEIPFADSTNNNIVTSIEYNVNQKNKWEGTRFGYTSSMIKLIKSIKNCKSSFPSKFVIIEVPAMNFCFVHEIDKTSKDQRNFILDKCLNNVSVLEGQSDTSILKILKQRSKEFDSNFPG